MPTTENAMTKGSKNGNLPYDQNRAERVNVAYPPATQTLNIKFFEETNTGAENNGI